MKKFLSLVLALVMTMSLVTVSAGAEDFADDGEITYKEAVDVISALGIVDGYSDDSFRPDGVLTRGAAAKIICNLILGPTTAEALSAGTAPFKDVPVTNTFAGYITYCSQQGIISGYADGTFRPTGTLSGNAFMKMLLGALGYDSSIEGYTGANWTVNVIKQAVGIGLDDGNDSFVGSQAVTRQEAALYSFNMLKSDMVQYDSRTTVNVNGATVTIAGNKAEKILQSESGYDNTLNDGGNGTDAVLQFAEKYFPNLTRTNDSTDAFGRPANEWKYRSQIIGSYTDYSDLQASYEGTKAPMGELYSLIGGSIVDELTPAGNRDGEYSFTVYVDGEKVKNPVVGNYFVKNSSAAAGTKNAIGKGDNVGQSGNGVLTEVFMDDDNNVTITMVNTYLVQATADYNSTREEITVEPKTSDASGLTLPALDTTISQDDFDVSGVKADDYLLVTWSYKDDEYVSVEPATTVTGTVSQYTIRDNVVVDGETLKYNKLVGTAEQEEEFSINSQASLVLDSYGYIIYVDDANSTSSYVYIQDVEGATQLKKSAVGAAYFTDGTYDEIDIKKVIDDTGASHTSGNWLSNDNNVHGWYTYTKSESGDYTLTDAARPANRSDDAVKNAEVAANTSVQIVFNNMVRFLNNSTDTNIGAEKVRANADTIFLVLDSDDEVSAYVGVENVPNVTIGGGQVKLSAGAVEINWVVKDNYAQYVFIDVSGDPNADIDDVTSVADYMLLLKNNGKKTVVADDTFYQYDVILDGEVTTRYIAESLDGITADTADSGVGNLYYSIKTNSKDYITDSTKLFADHSNGGKAEFNAFTMTNGIIGQSGRTIRFDTNGDGTDDATYLINSDAKVYLAVHKTAKGLLKDKGADYETYVPTSIGTIAGLCTNYKIDAKVYAVMDDDWNKTDGVDFLFVWIDGATEQKDSAVTPVISTHPSSATYTQGDAATALTVAISNTSDCRTLSYQWYKDGVAINGATSNTYTPSTATVGTSTYYCKVTNTDNSKRDVKVVSVDSSSATITVNAPAAKMTVNVYYTTDGKLTGYVSEETLTLNAPASGTVVSVTRGDLAVPTGYEVASGVPHSYIFTNGATETLYVTVVKTAMLSVEADPTIFTSAWEMGTPSKTTVKATDTVTVEFTQATASNYTATELAAAGLSTGTWKVAGGEVKYTYSMKTDGVDGTTKAVILLTLEVQSVTGDTLEITAGK